MLSRRVAGLHEIDGPDQASEQCPQEISIQAFLAKRAAKEREEMERFRHHLNELRALGIQKIELLPED